MSSEWYPKTETQDQTNRFESEAYFSFLLSHLSEEEQIGLARAMKAEDSAKMEGLVSKAMERTAMSPVNVWLDFKKKYLRAEELRRKGSSMPRAEHAELWDLIEWMRTTNFCGRGGHS